MESKMKKCDVIRYETNDTLGVVSQVFNDKKHRVDWYPTYKTITKNPNVKHYHLNIVDENQNVIASTKWASSPNNIPLGFIEKYCQSCGTINEIMVEYNADGTLHLDRAKTITIRKIKEEWDREEVIDIVKNAMEYAYFIGLKAENNVFFEKQRDIFISTNLY